MCLCVDDAKKKNAPNPQKQKKGVALCGPRNLALTSKKKQTKQKKKKEGKKKVKRFEPLRTAVARVLKAVISAPSSKKRT